mmetsp:Transcript_49243/g.67143  ORF Transcript_49243/g.67143 Transcript_49243/m.67143 type:complete len:274 (-) Transcript_49243:668-1489(-)
MHRSVIFSPCERITPWAGNDVRAAFSARNSSVSTSIVSKVSHCSSILNFTAFSSCVCADVTERKSSYRSTRTKVSSLATASAVLVRSLELIRPSPKTEWTPYLLVASAVNSPASFIKASCLVSCALCTLTIPSKTINRLSASSPSPYSISPFLNATHLTTDATFCISPACFRYGSKKGSLQTTWHHLPKSASDRSAGSVKRNRFSGLMSQPSRDRAIESVVHKVDAMVLACVLCLGFWLPSPPIILPSRRSFTISSIDSMKRSVFRMTEALLW